MSFPFVISSKNQRLNRNADVFSHFVDGPDPYPAGDVYTGITSQGWNINDLTNMPYLKHIKRLSYGWPHLKYLSDFMEVSTSPLKWNHLDSTSKSKRGERTQVTVLDFIDANKIKKENMPTIDRLKEKLSGTSDDNNIVNIRLFVVEDLSRDLIEAFGARFDIDPLFFRDHLADHLWYNTRDPWVELPDLGIVANQRNFFTMRFMQPRYFQSQGSFELADKEIQYFNVVRRLVDDHNFKPSLDKPGSVVALVRCKASLWVRKNKDRESGVLGILLVDPTITEGHYLWAGHSKLQNSPGMNSVDLEEPPRTSQYAKTIFWTVQHMKQQQDIIRKNPRALGLGILHLICAEWLTMISYITTRLAQIDWELEHPNFRLDPTGLDYSLHKLHRWRRGIPIYQAMVEEVLDRAFARHDPSIALPAGSTEDLFIALRRDFVRVKGQLAALALRVDRIVAVATAVISIEESKRAMAQNQNFGRLTYLAVVFVPLSFVASLFSMTADLGSLQQTFWIYVVVAVPLTCLALVVVKYMIQIRDMVRKLAS